MFLKVALLVLRKDVVIEVKSREILFTTLFFSVSCILVFSFAFVSEGQAVGDVAAGILWIAIAFSGTLALGRTFERERYGETLKALLLAPVARPAIYVGKLLGVVILLGLAELLLVPLVALLFSASLFARPLLLAGLLLTGTVGFSCGRHAVRGDARARADAGRAAADPVVSDHGSGDDCWRARHGRAAGGAARRAGGDDVDWVAGVVRRRVRDAGVVDVRAVDDGVIDERAGSAGLAR